MVDRIHVPTKITPTPEGIQAWARQAATIINQRLDSLVNTGQMRVFFGVIEDGWLECDGSAVSRETYPTLFSVIGTTYGEGDGVTTFNLPDIDAFVIKTAAEEAFSLDDVETIDPIVAIRSG